MRRQSFLVTEISADGLPTDLLGEPRCDMVMVASVVVFFFCRHNAVGVKLCLPSGAPAARAVKIHPATVADSIEHR